MLAHPRFAGLAAAHCLMRLLQFNFAIAFMRKTLSPAERSLLKARAHLLRPVVMLGSEGLSAAVLKEIDTSLKAHELIKIRVMSDDREGRATILEQICEQLGAAAVQHIGKILVVYRPSENTPAKKKTGKRKSKPLSKKQLGSR